MVLILALMLTAVSFANKTKNEVIVDNFKKDNTINSFDPLIENTIESDAFHTICRTHFWGVWVKATIFTMVGPLEVDRFEVHGGCTTCHTMGAGGVTSTVNCW